MGFTFDISTTRNASGLHKICAHLNIEHVLQLAKAAEFAKRKAVHADIHLLPQIKLAKKQRFNGDSGNSLQPGITDASSNFNSNIGEGQLRYSSYTPLYTISLTSLCPTNHCCIDENENTTVHKSIPVVSENVPEQAPALQSSATLGDGTITETVAKTNDHTDTELVAIDKAQLAMYDTLTVACLCTFANYSDAKNLIYVVENIPPTATWGIPSLFTTSSHFFAIPRATCPAHISVVPFGVNTASAARNVIDNLSFPNGDPNEECWGDIRASRWQSAYKAQEKTPKPFTDVYDARKVFKPKSKMDYYGATNLQMGNTVLMEAYIKCYCLKSDIDKLTPVNKCPWRERKVYFELKCVSLIHTTLQDDEVEAKKDKQHIHI
ncbi:hypothetical protein SERLADRAFT_431757 [Serpula lacrymans var. lacrymans S7.9]|uniref:Uncharacterized protein n=1 Tax=Serpula lacrymans var. lacrymans (strain S7.9) TaxID=578457 RepID=F8NDC2_SERL9|nr:uncharacterized protein SERLADRAFT_431757 [Serpula lacrymans var. lacrymans S7.9]EGO30260.1 hypothetical protein SERLADRAFT_431757 [Serpula lacrymans var. lacrymans S7.9]